MRKNLEPDVDLRVITISIPNVALMGERILYKGPLGSQCSASTVSPLSHPYLLPRSLRFPLILKQRRETMLDTKGGALPLTSLNHISLVCRSVEVSLDFYQNVLGFIPVRRPGSFDFDGAWLFNYGIGIHLLQSQEPETKPKKTEINPKDDHISFQCESMASVERKLTEMKITYIQRRVEEGGVYVDQLFFHDPDGFMIEICNCDNLPVIPLTVGEHLVACKRMKQKYCQPAAAAIHVKESNMTPVLEA